MLPLIFAVLLPLKARGIGLSQTPSASAWRGKASPRGTLGGFLRETFDADESAGCMPALGSLRQKYGFEIDPELWVDRQMTPGSRLIAVGDSVIGQMHALGKPGFSCSSTRPCEGEPPFRVGGNATWDVELSKTDPRYMNKGWQHLKRYMVRSSTGGVSQIEGWEIAPEVSNNVSTVANSAFLLQQHLEKEVVPTANDVLLIGMLGNHFSGDLAAFDRYTQLLLKYVVNPWPGRVVVLGTSPQHFKTKGGEYDAAVGTTRCAPAPLPSASEAPMNKYRSDIWGYNVLKHMHNKRGRYLDMYEMLHPLWRCHRNTEDCTHWQDTVISIQVQLTLEALQQISIPTQ